MGQNRRLLKLLRQFEVFSRLSEDALSRLQEKMQLVTYEADDILCREGDRGDRVFIIDFGKVSVLKQGEDGIPIEIAVLQPGDIAGELSLFGETTRSATLRATVKTKAWVLDYNTFTALIEEHPAISRALLSYVGRHLRKETSLVAKLLTRDLDRRFKVAFFDSKPYVEKSFKERNHYEYSLHFFDSRLSLSTVPLAAGFKVICAFVNDDLDQAVIEELANLGVEMIALRCAGYNNVDLKACQHHGISVARVPAYSPYAVAEHAVALMMTLNRCIHRANNRIREGNFSLSGLVGFDLYGKTFGLVGAGKIGKCLLNIMRGFGCRLLIYSRTYYEELARETGACFVEFDQLLAESDIISLHAPLTPKTFHLIDATAIQKMKEGVMLINTSRGALIDTNALVDGLKSGRIGYAGLDVYEAESDYFFEDLSDRVMIDDVLARLTTFNNVVITSHQAFLTQEALSNIADTTLENVREFELGKRLSQLTNHVASNV
jgi:D-lactate dehydrogenase